MSMPSPDARHERLHALHGRWIGKETMPPSRWAPNEVVADARVVSRMSASGFVLTQDYEQTQGGQVTFSGHGVLWVDVESDEVRLHFWDSMGMGPDVFVGGWEGERLILSTQNPMGHFRGTWELVEDGYRHEMELSEDGEAWSLLMSAEYRRDE